MGVPEVPAPGDTIDPKPPPCSYACWAADRNYPQNSSCSPSFWHTQHQKSSAQTRLAMPPPVRWSAGPGRHNPPERLKIQPDHHLWAEWATATAGQGRLGGGGSTAAQLTRGKPTHGTCAAVAGAAGGTADHLLGVGADPAADGEPPEGRRHDVGGGPAEGCGRGRKEWFRTAARPCRARLTDPRGFNQLVSAGLGGAFRTIKSDMWTK